MYIIFRCKVLELFGIRTQQWKTIEPKNLRQSSIKLIEPIQLMIERSNPTLRRAIQLGWQLALKNQTHKQKRDTS